MKRKKDRVAEIVTRAFDAAEEARRVLRQTAANLDRRADLLAEHRELMESILGTARGILAATQNISSPSVPGSSRPARSHSES